MQGFLGFGAPFALDFIIVALACVLPVLLASILAIRSGHQKAHRSLQIALTTALTLVLILFEWQIRSLGGWREIVAYRKFTNEETAVVGGTLAVHLVFSVTTPLLWIAALVTSSAAWEGLRKRRHHWLGRLAAADLLMTTLTGWLWYWVAFVR